MIWSTEDEALVRMAGGCRCQKQCPEEKSHRGWLEDELEGITREIKLEN